MKKLALKLSSSLVLATLFVGKALAQDPFFNTSGAAAPDVTRQGSLSDNVTTLINYFLGFLGLVAVAFLIYAGVLMVTAGGDEDQVGKARKIITYAVIGIVIILLSWTIVTFVTNAL